MWKEENEVYFLCKLCDKNQKVENQRKEACNNVELQVTKMKIKSNNTFLPALVGNMVRVPYSDVDRGHREARHILECILEITKDEFYRLWCNYMFFLLRRCFERILCQIEIYSLSIKCCGLRKCKPWKRIRPTVDCNSRNNWIWTIYIHLEKCYY